ncbi:MAG TPA: UDP-N-acetylmuramate--L-alanine ligase [Gemmatimonadaceae bacterium]
MISDLFSRSDDPRPVHFIGIAGAGMSALAELFARRGLRVTGCDSNPGGAAADLAHVGIPVSEGHSATHVAGARAVIYTSAIGRDHPELTAAREAGIPVIRRAEALGAAVASGDVVGVAGTHGKTTTTVMTTAALRSAGLNPTGIAGGRVGEWDGNMSFGSDRLFVVEADEYDRSFLALDPAVAVVTNVEADHLDIYADLADIRATFARYVAGARAIVLCADDSGANSLELPPTAEIIRYGLNSPDARLVATAVRSVDGGSVFSVAYDGNAKCEVRLLVPGVHNVRNALAAIGSGIALGVEPIKLVPGLEAFTGVERRFQRVADVAGVSIVDDYAHHPTEIAATIEAARGAFPGRRLIVAFQPHLYSRTRDFASEFGRALAGADAVFLTELYPAREQAIPGISSDLVDHATRVAGGLLLWRGERAALATALAGEVRSGDVVITVGAGDITRTARELRDILTQSARNR